MSCISLCVWTRSVTNPKKFYIKVFDDIDLLSYRMSDKIMEEEGVPEMSSTCGMGMASGPRSAGGMGRRNSLAMTGETRQPITARNSICGHSVRPRGEEKSSSITRNFICFNQRPWTMLLWECKQSKSIIIYYVQENYNVAHRIMTVGANRQIIVMMFSIHRNVVIGKPDFENKFENWCELKSLFLYTYELYVMDRR